MRFVLASIGFALVCACASTPSHSGEYYTITDANGDAMRVMVSFSGPFSVEQSNTSLATGVAGAAFCAAAAEAYADADIEPKALVMKDVTFWNTLAVEAGDKASAEAAKATQVAVYEDDGDDNMDARSLAVMNYTNGGCSSENVKRAFVAKVLPSFSLAGGLE